MKGSRKKSLQGFWNKGAAFITQSVIYAVLNCLFQAKRQAWGWGAGEGGLIITIKLFQSDWSSNQSLRFQRPILSAKIDTFLKLLRDTFGENASSFSCRDQTRLLTLGPYYSGWGGGGGGLGSVSCVDFRDNSLVARLHHHDDKRLSWWSEKLQRFCCERAWSESGSGSEETSLPC